MVLGTRHSAFPDLAAPHAEEELLPVAAERRVAVIVNRPFEGGSLMQRVRGKPLPPWAAEFNRRAGRERLHRRLLSAG